MIGSSPQGGRTNNTNGGQQQQHGQMNGAAISPRLPASNSVPAASSPRLPAANSLPPGSTSSPLSFNFNSLSPVKGLSSPAKSGGVPASDGNFAYRDPRLPANWWVSVEWVGGDLRYGYHSPAGDRLRSPSEVAHYLQVHFFKTFFALTLFGTSVSDPDPDWIRIQSRQ